MEISNRGCEKLLLESTEIGTTGRRQSGVTFISAPPFIKQGEHYEGFTDRGRIMNPNYMIARDAVLRTIKTVWNKNYKDDLE